MHVLLKNGCSCSLALGYALWEVMQERVKWVQETVPVDNLAVEKIFLDALESIL